MRDQPDRAATYAEYQLSCSEALVAGTLALMTAHAQAADDEQRLRMAQKIGANLTQLAAHNCMSPQFRMMLGNLVAHWQLLRATQQGDPLRGRTACATHAAAPRLQ